MAETRVDELFLIIIVLCALIGVAGLIGCGMTIRAFTNGRIVSRRELDNYALDRDGWRNMALDLMQKLRKANETVNSAVDLLKNLRHSEPTANAELPPARHGADQHDDVGNTP